MDFTPGMSFSLCTGKLDQGEHIIDDIILSGNRYHEEAILCPYTGPRVVFWYLNSTQHSHAATHSTHVYSLQRLDRRSCYCEEGRKKTLVHCPAAHSSCIFLGKSLTVVTDMDWQSWFCQFLGVPIPALGPSGRCGGSALAPATSLTNGRCQPQRCATACPARQAPRVDCADKGASLPRGLHHAAGCHLRLPALRDEHLWSHPR